MEKHYSQKYCVRTLIDLYCTEEWKSILKESEKTFSFQGGVTIFKEGEVAEHVIILKKGKVKVYSFVDKEKEQILRLVSDDQILGHRSFGGGFKLPVSATTLTQCDLVYIPVDVFLGALKANNDFCFQFMMFFAEELKNSEQHIKLKGAKNLNQRVATAILDNVAAFGYSSFDQKTLDYTISRKEFANFSNTTYESIVRTLKKFSELGLLEIKGKNLKILDEKGLVKISTLNY